jgi:hypothetical protein
MAARAGQHASVGNLSTSVDLARTHSNSIQHHCRVSCHHDIDHDDIGIAINRRNETDVVKDLDTATASKCWS